MNLGQIYYKKEFQVRDFEMMLKKCLYWADQKEIYTFLNPNNFQHLYPSFPFVLAAGSIEQWESKGQNSFEDLKSFTSSGSNPLFGYFSYDLKNEIEKLSSNNPFRIAFPNSFFFKPEHLITFEANTIIINSIKKPEIIFEEILQVSTEREQSSQNKFTLHQNISREEYIASVKKIKQHIEEGDVYELNFCIEFYSTILNLNPIDLYLSLNTLSPMPFSGIFKHNSKYLVCASPERFLKKEGTKLISQPIKGTARRGNNDEEDEKIKQELRSNEKELAENMMIVDLVRNDLARSCKAGTIKVEEIFGVYTFKQVHQLISTIVGEIKDTTHFIDAIKNAFPMGSMTGAPKIKAMELIEKYEKTKRGLYSGAIGYIDTEGNFDFNVVIRSILYDASNGMVSFQVGSAITYDADPEKEYEECLLKAEAMIKTLKLMC